MIKRIDWLAIEVKLQMEVLVPSEKATIVEQPKIPEIWWSSSIYIAHGQFIYGVMIYQLLNPYYIYKFYGCMLTDKQSRRQE